MRKNRVLTVELRLIDVEDDQHDACKELTTNLAKDLHAAATLLCGGASKPKVYHFGESYRVEIGKLVDDEQKQALSGEKQ
jgi:hypothetical protein